MHVSHCALLIEVIILIAVPSAFSSPTGYALQKRDNEQEEFGKKLEDISRAEQACAARKKEIKYLEKTLKELRKSLEGKLVPGHEPMPAPSPAVKGIVKETTSGGLVHISIGRDVGLKRGHILKVFRLDPKPEDSKFLGTIEIVSVRPHEAVARRLRSTSDPLKPGDHVADRIRVSED